MQLLIIRVILYILSGVLGVVVATYPGMSYNADTQVLIIDVQHVSETLGAAVTAFIGGGSFLVSRIVKRNGGVT